MRTALFRSSSLMVATAALFAAGEAHAQDAASDATHTVKRGDTLWDLSRTYLGDPFLWPEIYRINTDVVEDPHWIFPGEVLRIPGRTVAQTPPPALTEEMPPETPVVQLQPAPAPQTATVFANSPFVRRTTANTRRAPQQEPHFAVRPGEYYAAPWVDRRGGPDGAGELIALADVPGILQARDADWMQMHDRAYVSLPRGATAAVGDNYLVYRLGAQLSGGQQVIIPVGVVRVTVVGAHGEASTVRLVQQFDVARVGDRVMPLERAVLPLRAPGAPVDLGVEGQIVWIPTEAVLPSLQHYVLLDVTTLDGVRLGDSFTIFRPRSVVAGHTLPEEEIALVQIVRVNERGATGLIVDQRQPAITRGASARLTARLP